MKLNISRNTIIATETIGELMIEAIKKKHPKALVVDVDLNDTFNISRLIYGTDPLNNLKFFVHYTIKTEHPWGTLETLPDEFFLYQYENHGHNWTFDYIIFHVKNWEPYYWKYPDGIVEKIAMLSYFVTYGYSLFTSQIYSGISTDKKQLDLQKYYEFAYKWDEDHFVILSKV